MRRRQDKDYREAIRGFLLSKYRYAYPDLIIVSDDAAFNLLLEMRAELFQKVPLVFCGLNNFNPERLQGLDGVTGVNEEISIVPTLDLAMKLFPRTERIFALVDDLSAVGKANLHKYRAAAHHFAGRLSLDELLNLTIDRSPQVLSGLPKNSLVLYLSGLPKPDGSYLSRTETMHIVAQHAPVPVLTLWASAMGEGALGGYVISGDAQGRMAGELAGAVLSGTDPVTIPVVMESPNVPMFDYQQMLKFGIPESALPEGSEVVNRPFSFYREYRLGVWLGVLLLVSLAALVLTLLSIMSRRKEAEEKLRSSEVRLRRISNTILDAIIMIDHLGRVSFWNPAAEQIFGYCSAEALGQDIHELLAPGQYQDDYRRAFAEFQQSATGSAVGKTIELPALRKDGHEITIDLSLSAFLEGSRWHAVGIARDTTERKRTEEELHSRELYLRMAVEAGQVGLWTWDTSSAQLTWNNRLKEIFGLPVEGESPTFEEFSSAIHPADREETLTVVSQALSDQKLFRHEYRILWPDGSTHWVHAIGQGEYDDEGRAVTMVGSALDMTEQKHVEEALRESEGRFQKMFREHDAIMMLIEPESGRIVDINDAARNYYGYSREEFNHLAIQDINMMPQEEAAKVRQLVKNGIQTNFEFKHRLANGETRDIEAHISCIEINKQPLLFPIINDISDRKRLMEEQTRGAQLAALGTLAAGVAHEINNPIQGILNYASLIEKSPDRSERNKEMAHRIVGESLRIAKITQDLLFYSKDSRQEYKRAGINEVIEGALSLVGTKVRRYGIELRTDFQPDLPQLRLQPQSIQQVVINLVDNAYDAIRELGENAELRIIRLSTRALPPDDPTEIELDVYDNGVGIPPEVMPKAQQAFFTTKPSSQGTGLGLSIVSDIVNKHGGRIELASQEGEFTSVKVFLPIGTAEV